MAAAAAVVKRKLDLESKKESAGTSTIQEVLSSSIVASQSSQVADVHMKMYAPVAQSARTTTASTPAALHAPTPASTCG